MAAPSADSINEILHATVGEMLAVAEEMEATDNSNGFLNHIEGFAEIMSTISALTDTDIDENVFTILRCISPETFVTRYKFKSSLEKKRIMRVM